MKKYYFSLIILVSLFLFNIQVGAQAPATIDFETVGQNWTWTVFANGAAQDPSNFSVVSNPLVSGINLSGHCAKLVVNSDASKWAGVITGNIPQFTLDNTNCIVKVMVYKDHVSPFQLEFKANTSDTASPDDAVQMSNTTTNGWEELTFDFSPYIGHTYACLVVIPDFPASARTYGSINYWDNISFGPKIGTGLSQPKNENISLYPNPLKDVMFVKSDDMISNVIVRNLAGQVIKTFSNVSSFKSSLNVSQLSSGIYFVTLEMQNGSSLTQKIMKL